MHGESSTKTGWSWRASETVNSQASGIAVGARYLPSWLGIAAVLALTFAAYSQTLHFQFVHDDVGQIVQNPAIHSWKTVPSYFTSHVWQGFNPDELGNYFRPIFLLWLRINDAVFGNQPWGWHLTTVLSHLLATFLVYLLIQRLGMSRDIALLAALIFGLHPSHIEAVAWIAGVTEPLLGIFLIVSFLCYLLSRPGGKRRLRWKFISLAAFALATLEKETALIFPAFLLVYEWLYRPEWGSALQLKKLLEWCGAAIRGTWTYFLVILFYLPARIHALKGFSHLVTNLSTQQWLFTWPELIWFWIRHLLWPVGLSTFYELPAVLHPTLRNFSLPAIIDVGAGLVLFACARGSRPVAFFATWLVLPLIPVLNLRAFPADDFAHDRYLYLPSVGLAVLLAMVLKKMLVGSPRYFGFPASLFGAALCLAIALGYGTASESLYFKDNLTFYAYNYSKAPHNRFVEVDYGSMLGEKGSYGSALEILTDLVKQYPDFWEGNYNLAYTYYKLGRLPEAEEYFLKAIRLKPGKADAYLRLGMTLLRMGRTPEAIAALRQAIAIRPNERAYHFALGVMLRTQGDLNGARAEFQAELANYPEEQGAADQLHEVEKQLHSNSRAGAGLP